MRPAWPYVISFIQKEVETKLFDQQGKTADDVAWEKLSIEYGDWKRKHFPGNKTLVLTGRLRMQMTGIAGDHFVQQGATRLEVGSNYPLSEAFGSRGKPYRGYLGGLMEQIGPDSDPGAGSYPRRPPMRLSWDDRGRIIDIMLDHITHAPIRKGARRSTPLAGVPFKVYGAGRRVIWRNPSLKRP
jgi:hypothetical protein